MLIVPFLAQPDRFLWEWGKGVITFSLKNKNKNHQPVETSLVVQWLRILLQSRGHGFDPRSGKIPHAEEQVSLHATRESLCMMKLRPGAAK